MRNRPASQPARFSSSQLWVTFFWFLFLCSCSLHPGFVLPIVSDEKLEAFVADEGARLLRVSESADRMTRYRFYLVKFPRDDILGLSLGEHRIFINYELGRLAYAQPGYRWLLRQTLAHEIAHDVLGHALLEREASLNIVPGSTRRITGRDLGLPTGVSFSNYSRTVELAADQKAIEYWQKIGWDCRIWITIFQDFLDRRYQGDPDHPTEERLRQAIRLCGAEQRYLTEAGTKTVAAVEPGNKE